MESNTTPNPQDKQITVDVPEDRVAEFHAFFARFLTRATGPGRRGRHRHSRHRLQDHRCGERSADAGHGDTVQQAGGTIVA